MENSNYQRIETAIQYLVQNFRSQPTLEEVASSVDLSPFHFQRLFVDWAGVSPKKFMQFLTVNYAKELLSRQRTVLQTALESGLSGTGRLHDLFVGIEAMTPGEFKAQGANLRINYSFLESPFGRVLAASTPKGVCHLHFAAEMEQAVTGLQARFPEANFQQRQDEFQLRAAAVFQADWRDLKQVKLHLAATPFQLKVWESLLRIPFGHLTTYGEIAKDIGRPSSSRAVGGAVGANPVAFLIPCHRVIQSSGKIGGYMWGPTRKSALIGWEASQIPAPASNPS